MPFKDLEHDTLEQMLENPENRTTIKQKKKISKEFQEKHKEKMREEYQKLWLSVENDLLFKDI